MDSLGERCVDVLKQEQQENTTISDHEQLANIPTNQSLTNIEADSRGGNLTMVSRPAESLENENGSKPNVLNADAEFDVGETVIVISSPSGCSGAGSEGLVVHVFDAQSGGVKNHGANVECLDEAVGAANKLDNTVNEEGHTNDNNPQVWCKNEAKVAVDELNNPVSDVKLGFEKSNISDAVSQCGNEKGNTVLHDSASNAVNDAESSIRKGSLSGSETVNYTFSFNTDIVKTELVKEDTSSNVSQPDLESDHMNTRPCQKGKIHKCLVCDLSFSVESKLKTHQKSHAEKERLCPTCGESITSTIAEYKIHMRTHTGGQPFSCVLCEQGFRNASTLQRHKQKVHVKVEYRCPTCDRLFKHAGSLTLHVRSHANDEAMTCTVCKRRMKSVGELAVHMRSHTGEKPHQCSYCEKRYSQLVDKRNHERRHTGDLPFMCSVCAKKFKRSQDLNQHMRIHTGERPYKCEVCSKAFKNFTHRKQHMLTHNELGSEMTFACEFCDRIFKQKHHLVDHLRTHTGEKPFECSYCGKFFSHKGACNAHIRIHTGEKPFVCEFCEKGFRTSSDLKKHVRSHTGEQPFVCSTCGLQFQHAQSLKKHVTKKHTG